jgi:hypothetical protein
VPWEPIAATGAGAQAYKLMHELNAREMRKRGLRMW